MVGVQRVSPLRVPKEGDVVLARVRGGVPRVVATCNEQGYHVWLLRATSKGTTCNEHGYRGWTVEGQGCGFWVPDWVRGLRGLRVVLVDLVD